MVFDSGKKFVVYSLVLSQLNHKIKSSWVKGFILTTKIFPLEYHYTVVYSISACGPGLNDRTDYNLYSYSFEPPCGCILNNQD